MANNIYKLLDTKTDEIVAEGTAKDLVFWINHHYIKQCNVNNFLNAYHGKYLLLRRYKVIKITPSKKYATSGRKSKTVDKGKIMALHNAGWTVKEIGYETGYGEDTIQCVIQENLKKKNT